MELGYLYIGCVSHWLKAASREGVGVNFLALLPSTWAGDETLESSWTVSAGGGWKPNVNGYGQDTNTSVIICYT